MRGENVRAGGDEGFANLLHIDPARGDTLGGSLGGDGSRSFADLHHDRLDTGPAVGLVGGGR